jgi:hypothetical protein
MKYTFSVIVLLFIGHGFIFGQNLKTFSGPFQETIWGQGKATYTYYEKDNQEVRHGKFKYEWSDNDTKTVRNKKYSYKLNKKITGSYKNGRKDGVWNFTITFVDYPLHLENRYETGSISKTASYKEGKPHGKWKYRKSFKSRDMTPVGSYSWKWSNYDKTKNISVDAEFNNGIIVGTLKYEDPVLNNESAYFKFDNEGFLTGEQKVKSLGNEHSYTIKDKILLKQKTRKSDGSIEVSIDLSNEELTNEKFSKDTLKFDYVENNILKWFNQYKYFNQECCIARTNKKPLIYGCDLYEFGLKGANFIELVEAYPMSGQTVGYRLRNVRTEYGSPDFINEEFIDYETKELKISLYDEETMIQNGLGAHIKDQNVKAVNKTNKYANDNKKEFTLVEIYDDIYRLKAKINAETEYNKTNKPILQSDLDLFNKKADSVLNILKSAHEKREVWLEEQKQKKTEIFSDENYRKYLSLDDDYLRLIFDRLNDKGIEIQIYPILWFAYNGHFEELNSINKKLRVNTPTSPTYLSVVEQKIEKINNWRFQNIDVYWGRDNRTGKRIKKQINSFRNHENPSELFNNYTQQSEAFLQNENMLVGDINYIYCFAEAYFKLQDIEYNKNNLSIDEITHEIKLVSSSLGEKTKKERRKSIIQNYEHAVINFKNKMKSTESEPDKTKELVESYIMKIKDPWIKLHSALNDYQEDVLNESYDVSIEDNFLALNKKVILLSKLQSMPFEKVNELAKSLKKEIRKKNYTEIWKNISNQF